MNTYQKVKIFLASPGDLPLEREVMGDIIKNLQRLYADENQIFLELVKWETHSYSDINNQHPQEVIFNQIGEYDIFIGLMYNRFGTPTNKAESGTEDEFNHAFNSFKSKGQPYVSFFFKKKASNIDSVAALEQKKRVIEFKEKISQLGLIDEFKEIDEFKDKISFCIKNRINQIKKKNQLQSKK